MGESAETGLVYNNMGVIYSRWADFDKAIEHYQKSLDVRRKVLGEKHPFIAWTTNNIGLVYLDLGDYHNTLKYLKKGLEMRIDIFGENHLSVAESCNDIGLVYGDMGYYDEALGYGKRALKIRRELLGDDHLDVASSYANLGNVFKARYDADQALLYYERALDKYLEQFGENNARTAILMQNVGLTLLDKDEPEQALSYFQRELKIEKEIFTVENPRIARTYYNLAVTYYDKEAYDQAKEYLNKALHVYRQTVGEVHANYAACLKHRASIHRQEGEWEQAVQVLNRATDIYQQVFGPNHRFVASSYNELGKVYTHSKSYEAALMAYGKAVNANLPESDFQDIFSLPSLKGEIRMEVLLLESLGAIGRLLSEKGKEITGENQYETASNYFALASELIDKIRLEYKQQSSRLEFQDAVIPVYENAIENLYRWHEKSGDKVLLDKIFLLTDKSKSSLLQDAITQSHARRFAGIPDDVLELERQMRVDLAFYKRKLFVYKEPVSSADSVRMRFFRAKVFSVTRSYDSLIQKMISDYPQYYELAYHRSQPTVREIQLKLNEQMAVINYFSGDSSIFVSVLTADTLGVIRIALDFPLEEEILGLRKKLENPFGGVENEDQSDRILRQLFVQIFEPISRISLPERLIIIPDGVLAYVPFEILLTKAGDDQANWKNQPYLLKTHRISYLYASNFLNPYPVSVAGKEELIAFAPEFDINMRSATVSWRDELRQNIGPLTHNVPEVRDIQEIIGGRLLIGEEANERNFYHYAPQSRIIHISSHAKVNDSHPLYSRIYFQPDQRDSLYDGLLEVAELFNMQLNSEMVVLSACETGIGKLHRGRRCFESGQSYDLRRCQKHYHLSLARK